MATLPLDEVFNPAQPVRKRGFLIGRNTEVERVVTHLTTPGTHLLICGVRGVGKTSIARVAEVELRRKVPHSHVDYMQCDTNTTFRDIAERALRALNPLQPTMRLDSPAIVAEALDGVSGFLLIDEFDRLKPEERRLLADLMKVLSDRSASFSICIVGVARNALDLFGEHPSVARCLVELPIHRLTKPDAQKLADEGFRTLSLRIRADLLLDIARISRGYPSNAVLLCRYIAETVIGASPASIDMPEMLQAMSTLLSEKGLSSRDAYLQLTSGAGGDDMKLVLNAASKLDDDEFTESELATVTVKAHSLSRPNISAAIALAAAKSPNRLFDTVRANTYQFRDLRMPMIIQVIEFMQLNAPK